MCEKKENHCRNTSAEFQFKNFHNIQLDISVGGKHMNNALL